jgi:two-component system cell cycle response regulator
MGGHVLIVDRDAGRRVALRAALRLPDDELREASEPADLPVEVSSQRPDLLLVDLEEPADPALDALRWIRRRAGDPLPAIALVPPGRPDLRLAALSAGAEDATDRDTTPRVLQARVRSLLRQRDSTLEMAPREEGQPILPGLGEAPAAFAHALFAPAPAVPATRARVALLSPLHSGASPSPETVSRLLEADVVRLESAADLTRSEEDGFDLIVIDGAGVRGDLVQGAQVLAHLADLQGRLRARQTATLVLLPEAAVETAALALDLGASDVVAGPVSPREVVLRARALIARNRLRQALRDQVRLGLRAALKDPLTGLYNRRYAEGALRRLGEGVRQTRRGLAVVMVDIDHFKALNDTHGHAAGDRVLVEVASRLQSVLRPTDLIARVGGEEFLVVLPEAGAEEALQVAERLRVEVGRVPFGLDPEPVPTPWTSRRDPVPTLLPRARQLGEGGVQRGIELIVTVSAGVAAASAERLEAGLTLAELLKRADDALFEAKKTGRNAVVTAPEAA